MAKRATIINLPKIGVGGELVVERQPLAARKLRRPSHPFYLEYRPFQLQPFLIAPVLPGETMTNALLQARCVSDPVKNKLIGWWHEFYFFYVKLSDLASFDDLSNMLLKNVAPANSGFVLNDYYQGYGFNFVGECLDAVVTNYFRDEEEIADGTLATRGVFASGAYMAKINRENAFQSLTADADVPAVETEELPGQGYDDLPAHLSGFADQFAQWKEMVAMKMTEATFDDWVKQFGIRPPREEQEELHIPELIRYVREWSYPANTVDPATGGVTSALSWSTAERADKDRLFKEPGFVFGVCTARPKVYLANQQSTMTNFMNDAYSWLPALLQPDPYTSLKKFANDLHGPIGVDVDQAYWVDLRDLFMYGEQFTNVAVTSAHMNVVSVPRGLGAGNVPIGNSYPLEADIDEFFSGVNKLIRCDGRVDLSIKSRLEDTTP